MNAPACVGLTENTLVVFASDHGHFYGQHGLIAKGPFHYEDMVRVPLIVSQPGCVPTGVVSDSLQSLVDFAPTVLSYAGLDMPRAMSGVDETAVWRGQVETIREHVIVENHHQPTTIHMKTYVDNRYKITVYFNHDYGELFDLQSDPQEVDNLWDKPAYGQLKAELTMKLLQAEMEKEILWMPRIAQA